MDASHLFDREIECEDETILTIKQSFIGDVGCVVWDAALVLAKYLETSGFRRRYGGLEKKRVLELGAGTGATGLVACRLGRFCLLQHYTLVCRSADVVLTDLPDFVPLMEMNIQTNQSVLGGSATARVLKWGDDVASFLPSLDLILMSDCVYYPESVDPLVKTLVDLTNEGGQIICCYEERTIGQNAEAHRLFDELMDPHFRMEEIPREELHPVYRSEEIHVKQYRRKTGVQEDTPS